MTLSNGIRILNEFERVADCTRGRTLQSQDIMKTGNTASGMVLDSRKPRQHLYLSSRIENVVIVREADTPNNFGQKGYLKFENVTMVRLDVHVLCTPLMLTHNKCPMHKNLIDVSLLEASEKAWVNSYHQEVFEKVSPLLVYDTRALEWLKRETSPLESP